jgi:hypothetical protein
MRIARPCPIVLAAALQLFAVPALADPNDAARVFVPGTGGGKVVPPIANATTPGSTAASASPSAGRPDDVKVTATVAPAAKSARPIATPRLLRRMNAERFVREADMQSCSKEIGTPGAATLAVRIGVSASGEVDGLELDPKATPSLASCVAAILTKGRFVPPGGSGVMVVLNVTVPAAPAAPPRPPVADDQRHAQR